MPHFKSCSLILWAPGVVIADAIYRDPRPRMTYATHAAVNCGPNRDRCFYSNNRGEVSIVVIVAYSSSNEMNE